VRPGWQGKAPISSALPPPPPKNPLTNPVWSKHWNWGGIELSAKPSCPRFRCDAGGRAAAGGVVFFGVDADQSRLTVQSNLRHTQLLPDKPDGAWPAAPGLDCWPNPCSGACAFVSLAIEKRKSIGAGWGLVFSCFGRCYWFLFQKLIPRPKKKPMGYDGDFVSCWPPMGALAGWQMLPTDCACCRRSLCARRSAQFRSSLSRGGLTTDSPLVFCPYLAIAPA